MGSSVVGDTIRSENLNRKCNNNTIEENNKHEHNITCTLLNQQCIKIYHQNIRSLRNKTTELLCHLHHDSPHKLFLTKHHLHHDELTFLHIDNYILGACHYRKSKLKGGVCVFVQNSIKFTSLYIDSYCLDQDFEVCAIHLNSVYDKLCILAINSVYDKLCILAIYSFYVGNFFTFLTNFDLILHNFFNLKFNFIICGDININYLAESH
jgi:hypothetical protein